METISVSIEEQYSICIPDEYSDYERLNSFNKNYPFICQLKKHEVAGSEG